MEQDIILVNGPRTNPRRMPMEGMVCGVLIRDSLNINIIIILAVAWRINNHCFEIDCGIILSN